MHGMTCVKWCSIDVCLDDNVMHFIHHSVFLRGWAIQEKPCRENRRSAEQRNRQQRKQAVANERPIRTRRVSSKRLEALESCENKQWRHDDKRQEAGQEFERGYRHRIRIRMKRCEQEA